VDRALDERTATQLRAARDVGVLVLAGGATQESLPVRAGAVLTVTGEVGESAQLACHGTPGSVPFLVDRLCADTAEALAAHLAPLQPAPTGTHLPQLVHLRDLPGLGLVPHGPDQLTGGWVRDRRALHATIGRTEQGPLGIDLCRHGPHALVAGTTGSGKSELLQTLITSMALNHPPDRCTFLLVDYKGGAAFAEAAALPHTVGVLTDLDGQTTARALRSLGAELTRREALLARSGVADIGELPEEVQLARLVIVVDEFATLAEELPGFVPGLVSMAQRGRSLGVHLVLATQRPAGVVSAEIRANCTLRICLRTTDEADSRDVLGVPDAAHLPIDLPGRAFVRTGSGTPVPIQVARVATPAVEEDCPRVRRWVWPPEPQSGGPRQDRPERTELAHLVAAVGSHARRMGSPAPHRPWLPPLPDVVWAGDLPSSGERRIPVGLVDRPDTQSQEVLELDLDGAGSWLAVGGPRSGRTSLLRTVLAGAVAACGADELHVHVLDHGGGTLAAEAITAPHGGTCLGGDDPLRAVRLLDRLADEVARRRAGAPAGVAAPRLLLLVDGVEMLLAQLDDCDPTRGSAAFLRLVRDGSAVGLTCVLTADRAVPGSRLAGAAALRLILPLADGADYAVAGIPPAAVPSHRPPGRVLVGDLAMECQLARSSGPLSALASATTRHDRDRPLHIAELPPDPVLPAGGDKVGADGNGSCWITVGPGGDEGLPLRWDLGRSGGLLVAGPPGSGRSRTLAALAADLTIGGVPVLRVDHCRPSREDEGGPADWIEPRDTEGLAAWLDSLDRPGVVVADDVGPAQEWPVLAQLAAVQRSRAPALVVAGNAAELAAHYQGPVAALRRARSGLLLCPGPAEADVLGIRLPRTAVPVRPGSGWLVSGGQLTRVQVAARRLRLPAVVG
jgi:S-DNA-T family DNA segregation ATPase FtsK/SpoIIIE